MQDIIDGIQGAGYAREKLGANCCRALVTRLINVQLQTQKQSSLRTVYRYILTVVK